MADTEMGARAGPREAGRRAVEAGAEMATPAVDRAAESLARARRDHVLLDGLPEACRPRTAADAYRIQDALIETLAAPLAGWKIGCTSTAVQDLFGFPEPISGKLLAPNMIASPARIDLAGMFAPALEVEFAFRLGQDLPTEGAPYNEDQVAAAVASLHPALEVPDARFKNWARVDILSLIADDAIHGVFIHGAAVDDWRDLDLARHPVSLVINGSEVSRGSGANVLGHPLAALAWLANHAAGRGQGLEVGQIVTTGSTCEALGWPKAGDRVEARFGPLGIVKADFV